MKKVTLVLTLLIGICCITIAQSVTIGTQVWMTENLNVDKFRNGDPIPQAKTDAEWKNADKNGKPAWCYHDNNPANGAKYGKLYNWHAVKDPRGLAPKGWHIPNDDDFINYLQSFEGLIQFSALAGSCRHPNGSFGFIDNYGYWWSSTEYDARAAWFLCLDYYDSSMYSSKFLKGYGFSVRCLRD
jgi:hypothetical protein